MNEVKQWFLDQSPRDQMMLSVGGIAVVLYILLFMVLMPLYDNLEKTQQRNLAAMAEQQRVRELAGQVMAQKQSPSGSTAGQNLNALLNESLREHGLTMENFQPSGNTARVRLGASEFNKVLAWLTEMEIKHGVQIKDLTITEQGPGAVGVNLQIARGE